MSYIFDQDASSFQTVIGLKTDVAVYTTAELDDVNLLSTWGYKVNIATVFSYNFKTYISRGSDPTMKQKFSR